MASDADSVEPAGETVAEAADEVEAAGPDGVDDPGGSTAAEPDDPGAEPGGAAEDGPAEVAKRGGPGLFLALTCGFVACLCCLGAVFVGGSVAWVRMGNLDDAIERLGNPYGWQRDEESALPWGAEVEISGPAEVEPVREWLLLIGTPPSKKRMAACLESEKKCTVEGEYLSFPVSVEFRAEGGESAATVHVG